MSLRVRTERDSAEGAGTGESKGHASNRLYRRLAWGITSLSLALVVTGLALIGVGIFKGGNEAGLELHQFFIPVLTITFSLVGSIIASRHWRNPIGWIFIAVGFSSALDLAAPAYALLSHSAGGQSRLPGAEIAQWLDTWLWVISVVLPFTFLLLLFPYGRLPSPRWRPVAWSAGLGLAVTIASIAFQPGPMAPPNPEINPFGIGEAADQLGILQNVAALFLAVGLIGSVAALVVRFRRSRGIEREQIKWLVYAVILGILVVIVASIPSLVWPKDPILYNLDLISIALALAGIAAAAGIAIMRYRLYEVDLIVNRTLLYGTLSVGILVTYLLTVGLLGTLWSTDVNLAAAIVTIGLTALSFQPLRVRLQLLINRRMPKVPDVPGPNPVTKESQPASEKPLTGRWLGLARAAWLFCAAIVALIFLASIPLGYALRLSGAGFSFPIDAPGWYVSAASVAQGLVSMLAALVSLALAGILFWKKRDDPMALLVSFYLLAYGIALAGPLEALNGFQPLFPGGPTPSGTLIPGDVILGIQAALFIPVLLFFYLFPNGHFVPGWTRYMAVLALLFTPLFVHTTIYEWMPTTTPLAWSMIAAYLVLLVAGLYAQIYRYRRVASAVEQQQTKWVVFGLVLTFLALALCQIPYAIVSQIPAGSAHPWWMALMGLGWWVSLCLLPISLAIAVTGYRLWGIDLILNRTLLYGTLTLSIIAIYVLLVAGLGILLRTGGNLLISLLATALIAVLFQPLRERLQRSTNRLIYGERDDPYAALSRLAQRLEATLESEAVLPTIVETVAQALKLPYAGIALKEGDEFQVAAEYRSPRSVPWTRGGQGVTGSPAWPDGVQVISLVHQSEVVGKLLITLRAPGEDLNAADRQLLEQFALRAGIAAHALRLTRDLQHSRARLVTAREEERRRIRRDLHDGLGPVLAYLAMQADNAREWTRIDPVLAEAAMVDITSNAQRALQDIRRLVYDLRPPALDELGLVGAVRQTAANSPTGLQVSVEAPDQLPALSAAVEVAAFRIAQETLNNVLRHSHAQHCVVRISAQEELRLEFSDDGVGLPAEVHMGVGLISMRERALELGGSCVVESERGGGTRVLARLPLGHHLSENG